MFNKDEFVFETTYKGKPLSITFHEKVTMADVRVCIEEAVETFKAHGNDPLLKNLIWNAHVLGVFTDFNPDSITINDLMELMACRNSREVSLLSVCGSYVCNVVDVWTGGAWVKDIYDDMIDRLSPSSLSDKFYCELLSIVESVRTLLPEQGVDGNAAAEKNG